MKVMVETGVGDLVDRLTILRIKGRMMRGEGALENVRREREALEGTYRGVEGLGFGECMDLERDLEGVNEELWGVEDDLREKEREGDFGLDFVDLARRVYRLNDRRAYLKRRLNELTGSRLVEEKSYAPYESPPS